ncbi:unnamed protein product [Oikopleura dioica]|uniref:Tyrosine aminotransferase n=1 Tax=Oikopleura dioica TaxID=34765 RepID=E4Y496_OIKDI|nr:unnamed protein product [Oikopleura dioica]
MDSRECKSDLCDEPEPILLFDRTDAISADDRKWLTSESEAVQNTNNPIRQIVESMRVKSHEDYSFIPLTIGDPSVYGNFDPSPIAVEAVKEVLDNNKDNGYGPAEGLPEARKAISEYLEPLLSYKPDVNNIILASGASGALEFSITCIAERGDNILVPRPGFPQYSDWAVDIESLENMIDEKTRAVVFNNPSNPTGAVFKQDHMERLVELCEKYKIPIIADEVYAGMTFNKARFISFCQIAKSIPVIHVSSISKRFMVPGWRIGWCVVHDPIDIFKGRLTTGIKKLTTRLVGPNKLIQAAIPKILSIPLSWHNEQNAKLEEAANDFYNGIMHAPGLIPITPSGAMYMMVKIDFSQLKNFSDDMNFCKALVSEKSVFVLPGSCFGSTDFFRVVLTITKDKIKEACQRIVDFCKENVKTANDSANL